jgi:hypothetical protein
LGFESNLAHFVFEKIVLKKVRGKGKKYLFDNLVSCLKIVMGVVDKYHSP